MEQRTPEWDAVRKGRMTASRMAEAVGLIGSRRRLWRELTGREGGKYEIPRMTDGTNYEQVAMALYEQVMGRVIIRAGFLVHREHAWIGGSPDGLVRPVEADAAEYGGLEVKCPVVAFREIPDYHMPQLQGLMEVADLNWWDFMVWTPDVCTITRVWRSRAYWQQLHGLLCEFWTYVEADVEPPVFKRGTKPRITAPVQTRVLHKDTEEQFEWV